MEGPKQQQLQLQGLQRRPVRAMSLKVRLLERSRVLILECQRQQRQVQKKRAVVLVACLASVKYCNISYIYKYKASFVVH